MSSEGASSSSAPPVPGHSKITQVNDSLYELYKPAGTPRHQILFFHGLQLDNYSDAHISTWKSADDSCIWPQKWLVEEFPDAHVLTVSYSAARDKRFQVSMDMYNVGENLVSDLMEHDIGQKPYCPVILVGHSLGGLVMKEVLCQAHKRKSLSQGLGSQKLETFLDSVRGVFFYATPHHGSEYANRLANIINGPLLTYFENLSTNAARLNQEFIDISKLHERWRFAGLGETLPTRLPKILGLFEEVFIVPEASARGDNFNLKDGVDHFTISKPRGKNARNFYKLKEFIIDIDNDTKDVHQCQGLPRYSVDLEERALEVQGKLTDTKVLGIVGMGGIGKTTIAKQVFNVISKTFEYTSFMDNVKGIPIHDLQNFLLENFYWSGQRIVGRRISWRDLERKKLLIVMDDVDSERQLTILPQLTAFGVGSRLIITTRDEGILSSFESKQLYRVDFLDTKQAEKLFCLYAGLEDLLDSSAGKDQLKKNVKVVAEICGGLPLTLEVLGCYLRDHVDDANYWEQTIDKLRNAESIDGSQNDRVWDTLGVSYNGLAPKEQKMFIEAATYFFDRSLDRALAAWNGAYKNADTRWANLMSRSMVKIVSRNGLQTVWVHEQLRDLAKSLAVGCISQSTQDYRDPGDFDATMDSFNATMDSLNAEEVDENTEIVRLHNSRWLDTPVTIKFDFLVKLKNLKYLEMEMVWPGGSFKTFPGDLSVLRWHLPDDCTFIFPQIGHTELRNLAILELSKWEIPKEFPQALAKLTNLRILSLRNLRGLHRLPENFGNLSHLKQLSVRSLDLQRLPASLGSLSALEELTLWLDRLKCLPDSVFCRLRALKKLEIQSNALETLPDSLGQLESLQSLGMQCPTLRSLPNSLGELARLEYLDLRDCGVEALPATVGQLSALRVLEIYGTPVAFLPESFGELCSLRTLRMSWCHNFKKLPDSFGNLCALEDLFIDSDSLEVLPENGELFRIRNVRICSRSLRSLPTGIGKLPAIRNLELNCNVLEALPESLGYLSSLETLNLQAESLLTIPESTGRLRSLTCLTILSNCLRNLPASFGQLSSLQTVDLACDNLEDLPENFGDLCSLTDLTIECESLKSLPASFGQLTALQILRITCSNLETLPDNFGDLSSLERLTLKARSLLNIPESTAQLSSLTDLTIESEILRNLPSNLGKLSALKNLTINSDSLETLPDSFGNLSSLKTLDICTGSLVSMPESTGQLSALKCLYIAAANIASLPSSLGQLSALEDLRIWANSLETLPGGFGNLSSLRKLDIRSKGLVTMPDSVGQLASLTCLYIKAASISNLPSTLRQLSALLELSIKCDCLLQLPDIFADLYSLEKLNIQENSLDSFQEERLASLGWVLLEGDRVSPPRGPWELLLNCLGCAGLSRESSARSHTLLKYCRS